MITAQDNMLEFEINIDDEEQCKKFHDKSMKRMEELGQQSNVVKERFLPLFDDLSIFDIFAWSCIDIV